MVPRPIQRALPARLQPFSVDLLPDVYVKWLQRTPGRMFHLERHVIFLFRDKSFLFFQTKATYMACVTGSTTIVGWRGASDRSPQSPEKHCATQMTQFAAIKVQSHEMRSLFSFFLPSNGPNPTFVKPLVTLSFCSNAQIKIIRWWRQHTQTKEIKEALWSLTGARLTSPKRPVAGIAVYCSVMMFWCL